MHDSAWTVCWQPACDFADHELRELVHAVSLTAIGALSAARQLAGAMAANCSDGEIVGMDELIDTLARDERNEARMQVMDGSKRYGSVVVMAVRRV
jgi:hypothetical protein